MPGRRSRRLTRIFVRCPALVAAGAAVSAVAQRELSRRVSYEALELS
jgi:hypothetical protein